MRQRSSITVVLLFGAILALVGGSSGCAALRDDLSRAEQSYDQNRYDEALIWLVSLEDDTPDMDPDIRARFYYLRGMTAYRLGHRDDALHFLALTRELAGDENSTALRPEWRESLARILTELTPTDGSFRARRGEGGGSGDESTSSSSSL